MGKKLTKAEAAAAVAERRAASAAAGAAASAAAAADSRRLLYGASELEPEPELKKLELKKLELELELKKLDLTELGLAELKKLGFERQLFTFAEVKGKGLAEVRDMLREKGLAGPAPAPAPEPAAALEPEPAGQRQRTIEEEIQAAGKKEKGARTRRERALLAAAHRNGDDMLGQWVGTDVDPVVLRLELAELSIQQLYNRALDEDITQSRFAEETYMQVVETALDAADPGESLGLRLCLSMTFHCLSTPFLDFSLHFCCR